MPSGADTMKRVPQLAVFADPRYMGLVERAQGEYPRDLLESRAIGWVRDDGWTCIGISNRTDELLFAPPSTNVLDGPDDHTVYWEKP